MDELLGYEAARIVLDQARLQLALGGGGVWTDEDTLAAGLRGRLDDQLSQAPNDLLAHTIVGQQGRGYVVEDRLLGQIEADHLGDVVIDRLVVGDACPDRVGDGYGASA